MLCVKLRPLLIFLTLLYSFSVIADDEKPSASTYFSCHGFKPGTCKIVEMPSNIKKANSVTGATRAVDREYRLEVKGKVNRCFVHEEFHQIRGEFRALSASDPATLMPLMLLTADSKTIGSNSQPLEPDWTRSHILIKPGETHTMIPDSGILKHFDYGDGSAIPPGQHQVIYGVLGADCGKLSFMLDTGVMRFLAALYERQSGRMAAAQEIMNEVHESFDPVFYWFNVPLTVHER